MLMFNNRLKFAINLGFAAVAIVFLTLTFAAAEDYLTHHHMLADIEIANFNNSVSLAMMQ